MSKKLSTWFMDDPYGTKIIHLVPWESFRCPKATPLEWSSGLTNDELSSICMRNYVPLLKSSQTFFLFFNK